MAVQKSRTMFLDGEAYARQEVLKVYGSYLHVDWDHPPTDFEIANLFSFKTITSLEVEVPEGADQQFYYGIEYYLRMMQCEIKRLRAKMDSPSKFVRVTF